MLVHVLLHLITDTWISTWLTAWNDVGNDAPTCYDLACVISRCGLAFVEHAALILQRKTKLRTDRVLNNTYIWILPRRFCCKFGIWRSVLDQNPFLAFDLSRLMFLSSIFKVKHSTEFSRNIFFLLFFILLILSYWTHNKLRLNSNRCKMLMSVLLRKPMTSIIVCCS